MSELGAGAETAPADVPDVESNPAAEERTPRQNDDVGKHSEPEGDDVPLLKDEKSNGSQSPKSPHQRMDVLDTVRIFDLSDQEHATNHRRAQVVASIGLVFNVAMMLSAAMMAIAINSSMMFVISSQHMLDALGDMLVIWRFWCDPDDPNQERYDQQGCVLISVCATAACLYVMTFTSKKLIHKSEPHFEMEAVILSSVIFTGAFILGVFKFLLARPSCLDSYTLHLDAITSFFVSLLAAIYLISTLIHHYEPDSWALEHIAALIISSVLLFYALFNFSRARVDDLPAWKLGFWRTHEAAQAAEREEQNP